MTKSQISNHQLLNITHLQNRWKQFVEERGWGQFHNPKTIAMSLMVEAGELAEIFLWEHDNTSHEIALDSQKRRDIEDEIADVLQNLLHLADMLKVDLPLAIDRKMAATEKKYPFQECYGRKDKYTTYISKAGNA